MKQHREPKEKEGGSLKKRELCKGGRQHDWVEVLPFGVEAVEGVYNGDPEPYYLGMAAIDEFEEHIYAELESIGIKRKGSIHKWFESKLRPFMCSVCKKEEYKKKS